MALSSFNDPNGTLIHYILFTENTIDYDNVFLLHFMNPKHTSVDNYDVIIYYSFMTHKCITYMVYYEKWKLINTYPTSTFESSKNSPRIKRVRGRELLKGSHTRVSVGIYKNNPKTVTPVIIVH